MPSAPGFGNLTPAPHFTAVEEISHIEILYSYVGFTQKGVTIKSGQGLMNAGTALGRKTSDKKWYFYNNGASDGREQCRGILRDTVDTGTDANEPDFQGNIVTAGMLRNSKLSGVDAAAVADLNARQDTVLDIFQF